MLLIIFETGARPHSVAGIRLEQLIYQQGHVNYNLPYSDTKTGRVPIYQRLSP